MDFQNIQLLADLLKAPDIDQEDDKQVVYNKTGKNEALKPEIVERNKEKDDAKIEDTVEENHQNDWKKRPEFRISYKQIVNPADIFLQIDGKTPSISDCDGILVTIFLPGERRASIDIKTTPTTLTLSSFLYSLEIDLPRVIDPKKGSACWEADEEKLIVTLQIDDSANKYL